ncbi:MAG: hypothetical protein II321_00585 [Lachnospiraceae bacterium]|nr:hypothetical protein [Lachnospiraceae bacterium]
MIYIYNQISSVRDKKFIDFPYDKLEAILAIENGFKEYMLDAVKEVEQCNIDSNGNLISKFTNTPLSISKMSDGCKTIIYIAYAVEKSENSKELINITACGPNAIKYIFKKFKDCNLYLYLEHWQIPRDIPVNFKFNDVEYSNTSVLMKQ